MNQVRSSAEAAARLLRSRLGVSGYTNREEFDQNLDRLNISQTEVMLIRDSGLVRFHENAWQIEINADDPPARQLFTLAHEVGHVVLRYARQHGVTESQEEAWCNYFASEFLIPTDLVLADFKSSRRSLATALALRNKSGASFVSSFLKLNHSLNWRLGLICFKRRVDEWLVLEMYDLPLSTAGTLRAGRKANARLDAESIEPRLERLSLNLRGQEIYALTEIYGVGDYRWVSVEERNLAVIDHRKSPTDWPLAKTIY